MKNKYLFYLALSYTIFICACANQLPPTGGDDDKTPPSIIFTSPKPGTINFKDNKIIFRFDEYVDRRSFEEAFFISPKPKGEVKFDWSGKEVEVKFSKTLDNNKTYLVIIGKDLKDINGGNKLPASVSFAFSTGPKIDNGSISGRIYADNYDRVKILLYQKSGKTEDSLNPEKTIPDYIIQTGPDGIYSLTNLPEGDYRIFAVSDEDRNNMFDKDFDKIGIAPDDYLITGDSSKITNVNFLLKDFDERKYDKAFLDLLKSDSANFVFTNVKNGEVNITPDYRFYFYFKNSSLSKSDLVNNFSIADSVSAKSYRLVFNWLNDSLLEVFSTERFALTSHLKLKIDLTGTTKNYLFERDFSIAGRNDLGKVSGRIFSQDSLPSVVYLKLFNKDNPFVTYSSKLADTTGFLFNEVLEGNYILFSFRDEDGDGKINKGNYYPFRASEKFVVYENEIIVKGGWNVDNVFLKY